MGWLTFVEFLLSVTFPTQRAWSCFKLLSYWFTYMLFVFVSEAQGKHLKNRIKKELWVYWDSPLCQGPEAGIRVSAPWLGLRLDLGVPLAFSGPAWPKEWEDEDVSAKWTERKCSTAGRGRCTPVHRRVFVLFYSIFYLKILLSIVNLRYCVHFKCTAKQFSYTHAYSCSFLILIWFFPHVAVIEYWAVFPVLYTRSSCVYVNDLCISEEGNVSPVPSPLPPSPCWLTVTQTSQDFPLPWSSSQMHREWYLTSLLWPHRVQRKFIGLAGEPSGQIFGPAFLEAPSFTSF